MFLVKQSLVSFNLPDPKPLVRAGITRLDVILAYRQLCHELYQQSVVNGPDARLVDRCFALVTRNFRHLINRI